MSAIRTDEKIEMIIQRKLKEIEEKEKVKIIHAVESGSRSWGFASPDSDYDVRFIYVRNEADYLKLKPVKDTIEWELNETLDINGWDIRKALQLFYKSNVTIFEWANSPIIYKTTPQWQAIYQEARKYFSAKASMYQYYGSARSNDERFLQEEAVSYKKYLYVLRPLLACKWIERNKCPIPVPFEILRKEVLEDGMKEVVAGLLKEKAVMNEKDTKPRLESLNVYLEEQLDYFKTLSTNLEDDRLKDWSSLDDLFLQSLGMKG